MQFPGNPKPRLRRLRRQIERLRPYPALFLVVGPLAVVEPLKLATLFIAGEGHWITSGLVMLFAYAVSLFATHWLFVIVKPKLLTLPWFARLWANFVGLRDKARRWLGKYLFRSRMSRPAARRLRGSRREIFAKLNLS
jgi:hypothetical protein